MRPTRKHTARIYRALSPTLQQKSLGAEHPEVGNDLNYLGDALHAQGRDAEAEEYYRQSLELYTAKFGRQHHEVAHNLEDLAVLCDERGHLQRARQYLLEALEIRETLTDVDGTRIGETRVKLAYNAWRRGDKKVAAELLRQAEAELRGAVATDPENAARALRKLANTCREQQRFDLAEALYREVLELQTAALPTRRPDLERTVADYAKLLRQCDRESDAVTLEAEHGGPS